MDSLGGWERERVLRQTHLSAKPTSGSALAAGLSVLVLLGASLLYWANPYDIASFLPASRESVFAREEYWRLLTSMVIHADFEHFLSNAVVFGVLAFLLFGYYGPAVYPGAVLGLGMLVTALSLRSYPATTWLLGASGVVYLMAGFWLTLYLLIERQLSLRVRLVRAVGFGLIVLVPTALEPSVSYRTHAIGFAVGVAFALVYFSRRKDRLRAAERYELE